MINNKVVRNASWIIVYKIVQVVLGLFFTAVFYNYSANSWRFLCAIFPKQGLDKMVLQRCSISA